MIDLIMDEIETQRLGDSLARDLKVIMLKKSLINDCGDNPETRVVAMNLLKEVVVAMMGNNISQDRKESSVTLPASIEQQTEELIEKQIQQDQDEGG